MTHTQKNPGAKRSRGRAKIHANAAARQKCYRERLKQEGKRVVSRVIADVRGAALLTSDIIDLSACRQR